MPDRLETLNKFVASDPHDTFATYGLAMEHAKRGETALALKWFDRTLAIDPHYCYAYFHKARTQRDSGDDPGAIATLRVGLQQARACGDMHAASEIEGFLDEIES